MALAQAGTDDALFVIDPDGIIHPTRYAQGPWDPRHQHGGAVVALFAHLIEQVPTAGPMRVARLTADLHRAVPLMPLRYERDVVRRGRRIQVVAARLLDNDVEVARATGLAIRTSDHLLVPAEPNRRAAPSPIPPPGGGIPFGEGIADGEPRGYLRVFEAERIKGRHGSGVPSVAWFRLHCPVVAGTEASPLERVAAVSDFVSGLASFLDFREQATINPDLSLHLLRSPTSDWIGMDSAYQLSDDGIAQARAFLFDLDGHVGTVLCSALAV